jgi:hypothetical protein
VRFVPVWCPAVDDELGEAEVKPERGELMSFAADELGETEVKLERGELMSSASPVCTLRMTRSSISSE